jgi:hypothetical protein
MFTDLTRTQDYYVEITLSALVFRVRVLVEGSALVGEDGLLAMETPRPKMTQSLAFRGPSLSQEGPLITYFSCQRGSSFNPSWFHCMEHRLFRYSTWQIMGHA